MEMIIKRKHCTNILDNNPKIFDYPKICLTYNCKDYQPPKRERDKNDQILISHLEELEEETFTQRLNWEKVKMYIDYGKNLVCEFLPLISPVVGKACFVMESAEMAKLFNSVKESRIIGRK